MFLLEYLATFTGDLPTQWEVQAALTDSLSSVS